MPLSRPLVGLSLMLDKEFIKASYPLFENGEVEVLEWSFDIGWGLANLPTWVQDLTNSYSSANRLLGHGVSLSLFSGIWSSRQNQWLTLFEKECKKQKYRHISDHFGFTTDKSSAPMPVQITKNLLALAKERLKKITEITDSSLGLESLAFSFSKREALSQGQFLGELVSHVDGFLLLDLHNIYCQMANFNIDAEEILNSYPLDLVRELHVSGGSWSNSKHSGRRIRRDTHDNAVPSEVFELLRLALRRCPNVECIILERMDGTLSNAADAMQLNIDFHTIQKTIEEVDYAK